MPCLMRLQVACVQVPQGHVWLQGDNPLNSTDSRHYGPVPYALLRGRVFLKVQTHWPSPPYHLVMQVWIDVDRPAMLAQGNGGLLLADMAHMGGGMGGTGHTSTAAVCAAHVLTATGLPTAACQPLGFLLNLAGCIAQQQMERYLLWGY